MTTRRCIVAPALTLTLVAMPLAAQSISFGLRGSGSIPTGSFADNQATADATVIQGAKNGFGYGLDAGLQFGPMGIYAGFDHIKFDCETTTCRTDGKYTLQGVTAGVKLVLPTASIVHPYVKGGVTFNDLQGGYGGSSSNVLTTDKTPGYEVGVGADISLMGILSFTPQARYVGQELKAKLPGVNAPAASGTGVNYFSFDLGLSLHTPFGK
ncbi:MAG: outer membrane beta-barrel protein [Deltaproteobacteria bacterium]